MGFVKIFWKNTVEETYLPNSSIVAQIVSDILAQLRSYYYIQILLNLTWV